MDIVLPLLERDVDRYERLQRPTFERSYTDLGTTWIVTPSSSARAVEGRLAHLPGVRVIDEDTLVPELPWVRRLGRGGQSISWYLQQLIKLAAVYQVETEFALVLDADVVAVRPVCDADMVHEGRALRPYDPPDLHPDWRRNAGTALDMAPLEFTSSVTPSVLARDGVRLLADYAVRHLRPRKQHYALLSRLPGARRPLSTWRARLLGVLPWTEYQLYDTFMTRTGRSERFHFTSEGDCLYGNSVWWANEFADWEPGADVGHSYFFSVVQGWLDIPVADVEQKLRTRALLS